MKKGFTLIELLVVIAIIGILAAMILASISGARAKARDADKKNSLRQVKTALELYAQDNSDVYPNAGGAATTWAQMKTALEATTGGGPWMKIVPAAGSVYTYVTNAGGTTYTITAVLEKEANLSLTPD
ncbi:MAG: type II secretion system protein [Candidatus Berkelbacteria bacterium]|nr:type II secretion system protein [Candidatus Berkelbacteria bacterium]